MKYEKLELVQGSPEWIRARYDYVTASQVPVVMGLSPYQTPLGLFEEKCLREEREDNSKKDFIFHKGHSAERVGREYLEKSMGLKLAPACLKSTEHPWLMASLDGFNEAEQVILEAKYVGAPALREVLKGNIPAHHLCQVQTALLISRAKKCIYFATAPSGESAHMEILPDSGYFLEIVEASKAFHEQVKAGEPPEPTDKDYFEPVDGDLETLIALDIQMKRAVEQYEAMKKAVCERYKDKPRVRYRDLTIVRSIRKGAVQYKKIPVLKGIDLEKYRSPSTEVVTVKVTSKKAGAGSEAA